MHIYGIIYHNISTSSLFIFLSSYITSYISSTYLEEEHSSKSGFESLLFDYIFSTPFLIYEIS